MGFLIGNNANILYLIKTRINTANVYSETSKLEFKNIVIEEPSNLKGTNFEDYLNTNFSWSNEFIKQLQERAQFGDQTYGCINKRFEKTKGVLFSHPKNVSEYVPGDYCC